LRGGVIEAQSEDELKRVVAVWTTDEVQVGFTWLFCYSIDELTGL
jgi:hypothetical protein